VSFRIPAGRLRLGHWLAAAWLLAGLSISSAAASAQAAPSCDGRIATIVSDAPRIVGTRAPDTIVAGVGDNAIFGMGGNDSICAGAGSDAVHGGRGSDVLSGGKGGDRVLGGFGNDRVGGGLGAHDRLDAGPGDDSLAGGHGDFDVLIGGPGNDSVDGGPGIHDIASYQGAGGPIGVDLALGVVSGAEVERLSGIEDMLGGSGDDTLVGSQGSTNRLDGGPGADRLLAAGSGDSAFGGPGDDTCGGPLASRDSCGRSGDRDGTAVELYKSIAHTSSLVIVASRGVVNVTVDRTAAGYVVESRPGAVRVHLGDRGSRACSSSRAGSTVSCRGDVSSILASLGPGDDAFRVKADVPAGISSIVDGGKGSDRLRGGRGDDTIYAGDDREPDAIEGGGGEDVLYGVNIFHPRRDSGAATMRGGAGDDLLIGGQPCDGDLFDGGPGATDSASFARVRNSGTVVSAAIGGPVTDPDLAPCAGGRIEGDVEKIEGSPGPDALAGDGGANTLLGRGGDDRLDGGRGDDDCIGGRGADTAAGCELIASVP
jgi:Ca2+-binding RTX toxin-like protein